MSVPSRVQTALSQAARLDSRLQSPISKHAEAGRRFFAIGDPQTTCEKFLTVLDRHGLLGDDGFLSNDARLLSIGDHFDFEGEPSRVGREGLLILRWLAIHPPDQVSILAGNHDL